MSVIESSLVRAPASHRHVLLPCEIYQAWRASNEDAEQAFVAWCSAAYGKKGEAYALYRAACDREDVAAQRWLAV